jgi:hypothetical protein
MGRAGGLVRGDRGAAPRPGRTGPPALPIIAGDLQPVLQASAWLASGALTAQHDTGDVPADVAHKRALRFIDHQLSCLILGERPWAAGDPPLPLDGSG